MNRSFEYFNELVLMAIPILSEITTELNPQSRGINEVYRIGRGTVNGTGGCLMILAVNKFHSRVQIIIPSSLSRNFNERTENTLPILN